MYGIYGDIISAAESALENYEEVSSLLEYPEVQADKAYYLSVLSDYNRLKFLKDKLDGIKSAFVEEVEVTSLLSSADGEERSAILEEISAIKRKIAKLSCCLADTLGCSHVSESVYCRMKMTKASSKFGVDLFALIKAHLLSLNAAISGENTAYSKTGFVEEISFTAEGADVLTRLSPLTGAHRVFISQAKSEFLYIAVTPSATPRSIDGGQLKIDVFHSRGAGGQNVNKVETAVRVTHLPTGITVVCQDERSQLKNKRRALENIEKKLSELNSSTEKKRIEADIYAQYCKKNTPVSFDTVGFTMTDTRLKGFTKIPFPLSEAEFTSYVNGLIAL